MEALCGQLLIDVCRFDPAKFILEHYVDGDLVNSETTVTREVATPGSIHVWGK